jgi:hypothetical protein
MRAGRRLPQQTDREWRCGARPALAAPPPGPDEEALLCRVAAFAHADDRERAESYSQLTDPSGPTYHDLSAREQRLARMLFFTLWPNVGGFTSCDDGLGDC